MNTPIEISSLAEYINRIDEITDPDKSYLYRGQENETWQVTSSAYRRLISSFKDLENEADFLPDALRLTCQNYLKKIIGFFERNSAAQPYNLSVNTLGS